MKQEWKQWEGRMLGDRFPLRQLIGTSDRGAVFLTEREGRTKAAIKLVPVNSGDVEKKLAQWKQAATRSHPHLLQIFEMGRSRVDGADVLFLVMEYAEEYLSQILPQRALTPGEAKGMLGPIVDVLGYLHGKGLVHGHVKPTNILATGDQVKLSSDEIARIGEGFTAGSDTDIYDPPEKARGKKSAASDVWSLGVTLTQALTRQLPKSNGRDHSELKLPEGLSSPFLDIARNCLWRDPDQRWSVSEIASRLGPAAANPPEKAAPAPVAQPPSGAAQPPAPLVAGNKPQFRRVWIAIGLVVAAIVGGVLVTRQHSENPTAPSTESQTPVPAETKPSPVAPPPSAAQPESSQSAPAQPLMGDEIVHRDVPNIPKSARDTVQGKVKVKVRVDVDASGQVIATKFEQHGPSQYFARQAMQSAERWKFASAPDSRRQWSLLFEFGRSGTQVIPSRLARGH